jgi:hypothetical protein
MNETVMSMPLRRLAATGFALAASLTMAFAQAPPPPGVAPPPPPGVTQRNPVCVRLEAQLATIDRPHIDPARADQIKRYEDAARRQQTELDRLGAQAQKMGCGGRGFFSLFGGQPAQCGPINTRMTQMRANLDTVLADLQKLQGNTADREGTRRTVLAALGDNNCGPQYRAFAGRSGGGFFDSLFGNTIGTPGLPAPTGSDTYRTICVRTCDGYYFPVSYSTVPSKFAEDEQICQRMCPAAEVALYSHRNPGEDVAQAVSQGGHTYAELPNAFAYRKAFNPSCSCKSAGETWADALKHLEDGTLEQGDIVVTEEEAKRRSQPLDSKGRPMTPRPAPKAVPVETKAATSPDGKRDIRTVGPPFLPTR